ncbi:4Fe-4S dicluster domain-containing protein [Desulfofundulus thermobenzoicus]|uniref:4Fe-4S dicluster domain-containing protein n=1 Tax=Desulfofundulus thermobenzoicus TaxID=29376 RepID=A0A6N7IS15_9FIRM|nr:4Fe-4S dicluster domain-containing protein [Desulfofundulus thermobenzoicus]MQL52842.1 4Fe-4S dicluster domain-containing protein [Desulfofundulus thermobenzoicus]HHW43212.1 4Fe-4S dicluster domain-containing protein [Desulfotomaculum sp.]
MSYYSLHQNERKCISCHSCEVQCMVNKGLPPGSRLNEIIAVGPVKVEGQPRVLYLFMSCFHCEVPWCVRACPTGAMQKRAKDGVVFVDQEICVGCKSCILACPWGAPQWDEKKGKVIKCDYCKDRIDAGLKPACVSACPTNSLGFDRTERVPNEKRKQFARQIFEAKYATRGL